MAWSGQWVEMWFMISVKCVNRSWPSFDFEDLRIDLI
jgi:hypothetical protein